MNSILKITGSILLVFCLSSAMAVSEETETRLLEQALIEGAVTKEQKTAINRYFTNIAAQKLREASRYREMAELGRGGKATQQALKKQELLNRADSLEAEANSYKSLIF
jgi:hypothetical protein